jgi:hypothetical protein
MLQKTWEKSFPDYFFYKFKYFAVDDKDSLVYFDNTTYFATLRVIFFLNIWFLKIKFYVTLSEGHFMDWCCQNNFVVLNRSGIQANTGYA